MRGGGEGWRNKGEKGDWENIIGVGGDELDPAAITACSMTIMSGRVRALAGA